MKKLITIAIIIFVSLVSATIGYGFGQKEAVEYCKVYSDGKAVIVVDGLFGQLSSVHNEQ